MGEANQTLECLVAMQKPAVHTFEHYQVRDRTNQRHQLRLLLLHAPSHHFLHRHIVRKQHKCLLVKALGRHQNIGLQVAQTMPCFYRLLKCQRFAGA